MQGKIMEENQEESYGIAVDNTGNVLVTGFFRGLVDFDPSSEGVDNHSTNGYSDIFVTKLHNDGSYSWTQTIGGELNDHGWDIVTDSKGNTLLTGEFASPTVDFDPTFGVDEHSTHGDYDIFVMKLYFDGSYGWTCTYGGEDEDEGHSVVVDKTKNILLAGSFRETVDFDPCDQEVDLHTSLGLRDIFFTKIHEIYYLEPHYYSINEKNRWGFNSGSASSPVASNIFL